MEYEDVTVVSKGDVKVHGWFIPATSRSNEVPTVLFCHENAGNIGLRLPEFHHVQKHLQVRPLYYLNYHPYLTITI